MRTYRELQRRWQRQIGRRSRPLRDAGAAGFLVDGNRVGRLMPLSGVRLVAAYDQPSTRGRIVIGVHVFRARRCEHGVVWGGRDNVRPTKDLALCPRPGARGARLDSRRPALLELALRLDHRIDQTMRLQPSDHNRRLRLPQVWAGFNHADEGTLVGAGPEFEETCQWYRLTGAETFMKFRRSHRGLALYPLEWVSGQLDDSVELFADLAGLPRRQAFATTELTGWQGAMAFDLAEPGFSRGTNIAYSA